jgi:S-DNA-T family DNA segregation ATPase FtsK/SpoIIIE
LGKKKKKRDSVHARPAPIRREIWGIIFLLLLILLGVSLFSYVPGDPVFGIKAGAATEPKNLFGPVGAHLAGWIFHILGFTSFWLLALLGTLSFLSFRGKKIVSPMANSVATLILIVSFSGMLGQQLPDLVSYRGGEIRSGGLLGFYVSLFMKESLNNFGAFVFLLAVFIISFMFCTHLSFGWFFSKIALWITILIRGLREIYIKRKERKRKRRVREKTIQAAKDKPKKKVTIIEPKVTPKTPEQEAFPFMNVVGKFKLPPLDLLNDPPASKDKEIERESLEMNARLVENRLADFGVQGEIEGILPGPVITMYEFKPAPGVKISKVAGLSDDLALALRAPSIRIVAPIPGKSVIGIEIPNNKREMVCLKEILSTQIYKNSNYKLTIALGKDITGIPFVTDLSKMPHLLVAGATGTGKSISLNAMINSLLFKASPDMVRLLMIDPKRIELSVYKDIPHLLHPVVTQAKEATKALRWAVEEMERRYMLLSDRGVRNIDAYNRKILKDRDGSKAQQASDVPEETLPHIILVIDELADLMLVSAREVEEAITRLAQMARAAGIHLIIATQRPSVDVLTGIIKANFPTRISFQVSSKVDSRTILDTIGAESLLGDGDMLFMPPGVGKLMRIHGAYIAEEEVKRVTDFLRDQMKPEYDTSILEEMAQDPALEDEDGELDEKYDQAIALVMQTGQASISMIQRKLRVGYNRAARMIEVMEKQGIVGPSDGVKPREVYGKRDE